MTKISNYIKNKTVTVSSDVVSYCVNILGITETNARKRIQRLPVHILKIKGICSNKQSIIYLRDNWAKDDYFEKLVVLLSNHAKQHYAIISALQIHSGVVEKDKLASYSISPIKKVKGHKMFNTIIEDLEKLNLITEDDTFYYLSYDRVNHIRSKAQSLVQKITLLHFNEWARNIGLISYDKTKFNADFSNYQFGMVAPSYIKSLTSKPKSKIIPAFVTADILICSNIMPDDVSFIVKKMENISMQNQSAKFIPFLLTNSHNKDVYNLLKSNGIVVGNIDELFGNKYSETVLGIINLIEHAGAILKKNPEQYLKLLGNIEKLSIGKTYNLKGDLFEMVVGYYHGKLCQLLEIGKTIFHDDNHHEIDVYALYQDKVVFAECKGYNHNIDDDYVKYWLSVKIPSIREWALSCDSLKTRKIEFELWCTGGFTYDSNQLLSELKQKTKKYSIDFFSLEDMRQLARDKKVDHFEKIIKTYYTKEV